MSVWSAASQSTKEITALLSLSECCLQLSNGHNKPADADDETKQVQQAPVTRLTRIVSLWFCCFMSRRLSCPSLLVTSRLVSSHLISSDIDCVFTSVCVCVFIPFVCTIKSLVSHNPHHNSFTDALGCGELRWRLRLPARAVCEPPRLQLTCECQRVSCVVGVHLVV